MSESMDVIDVMSIDLVYAKTQISEVFDGHRFSTEQTNEWMPQQIRCISNDHLRKSSPVGIKNPQGILCMIRGNDACPIDRFRLSVREGRMEDLLQPLGS